MRRDSLSGIMLAILLVGMLNMAFYIQPINATSLRVHKIDTDEDLNAIDEMILDWEWTHNFDVVDPDFPVSVASDSDSNVIAAGFDGVPSDSGDSQWRIMKFDSAGNDLWSGGKTYNPTRGRDEITSVTVDSHKNIIAVGLEDPLGSLECPYWKIIKFYPDGKEWWSKAFDFPPVYPDEWNGDEPKDVAIDSNDNIIVVGWDHEDGGKKGKWRVMKFAPDGTDLWSGGKAFDPNPGRSDYAYGVAVDSNDNIVVVGSDQQGTTNADWGIKKLDPNGNIIPGCDIRIPFSNNHENPFKVAVDSNDNIIVVGWDTMKGPNDSQWRVVKFDPDCNEIWRWSCDWSSKYDRAQGVTVDAYDHIIVVGYDQEDDDYKWRIIKLNGQSINPTDSDFILWEETVNPLVDVDSYEKAWGVTVIERANIVVVGSDDADVPFDFDRQWRIMKFAYPPTRVTQELIETIKTWSSVKGTENSLTSKLYGAIHLLYKENGNAAVHELGAFINHVEALRGKKLTDEQADYLAAEAQRIIDLIEE